ncbi:hypothetical protein BKA70DRAFT_1431286 [Coprinopsis sp. MPI-PUGE-AT-0042]|nr:hypothetical protein BKA70DRAFT_1431286 [Coprinopsis sp. MPI-PUGE-AT-0042]
MEDGQVVIGADHESLTTIRTRSSRAISRWQSHLPPSPATTASISTQRFMHTAVPSTQVHHFAPTKDGTHIGCNVNSAGTIKANLTYVHCNSSGHPRLGCKETRYDATVSTHRIILLVVDWVVQRLQRDVYEPSVASAWSRTSSLLPLLAGTPFLVTTTHSRLASSKRVASSGGTQPPLGVTRENWEAANLSINNYHPDGGAEMDFDSNYQPKETEKLDTLEEAISTPLLHSISPPPVWPTTSTAGTAPMRSLATSRYKNANFTAQPEVRNSRMRAYLWNTTLPSRNGDPEGAMVIHKLTHCLSTRLTDGPLNSCLGMGERWRDFLATSVRANKVYRNMAEVNGHRL